MNLVFLCAAKDRPVGGIKVIHQLAEAADAILAAKGGGAFICHPNRPGFKISWFDAHVRYRAARFRLQFHPKVGITRIPPRCFSSEEDIVVLPELWARKYAGQLALLGVPYVILVQAGYFIGKGNAKELRQAYAQARAVWCVSDDTLDCVCQAFPEARPHTRRFHVAVDKARFQPLTKRNWISYIPGKLPRHAELLRLFADPHLPAGWEWKPLVGLSEAAMAETLGQSRIFVALAEMEGFGLPPLEAAFAGNQVIGYHAQGGREYWSAPMFTTIAHGDIVALAQALVDCAIGMDASPSKDAPPAALKQAESLKATYSFSAVHAELSGLLHELSP